MQNRRLLLAEKLIVLCGHSNLTHKASYELSGRSVFRLRLGLLAVALVEAVHATSRVDQLLLAREEGVAFRANFYVQVILARRAGLELMAAGAMHIDFIVVGMDSLFHFLRLPLYRRLLVL